MTRSERTFYVTTAGYNLGQYLLAPVYPLFLLSRGLDLFEINLVLAVYLLTTFLFDVPTGAVADRFGRKTSFVLACVVRALAFVGYGRVVQDLAGCLVFEVLDGIGTTLATGALDAWAVDAVRAEGDRRATDRMFARAQMITQVEMIVGGVACGYIGQADLQRPWYVAAGAFALTGVAAVALMRETPRHAAAHARPSLVATARTAVAVVARTPALLLLCLLTLAGAFALFPIWQSWQPHLQALTGEGPWLMGWILAATNLAALAGTALVPRLVARFGRAPLLAATCLGRALATAVAASTARVPTVVGGLMLQSAGTAATDPILSAWTNEHVGEASRATVLSIRSTFFTLGGAAGLVMLGLVQRAHGITAAWTISAALLALIAPGYLMLGRVATVAAPDLGVELPPPASKVSVPGSAS